MTVPTTNKPSHLVPDVYTTSFLGLRFSEGAVGLGGTGRARNAWHCIQSGAPPSSLFDKHRPAYKRLRDLRADPDQVLQRIHTHIAPCGTRRSVFELNDNATIESVAIPQRGRTTACISSQVGCARGCNFCATGAMGLRRQLRSEEIIAQVACIIAEAHTHHMPPVRNVVFMGMGEPLDNWQEVHVALAMLTDNRILGIAPKRVTLSTVGPSPRAILNIASAPGRVAWSLHTANNTLRHQLIATAKYSVTDLRDAFFELMEIRQQDLFIEITLIKDVNDSVGHAEEVIELLATKRRQIRINLIPLNTARAELQRPRQFRIDAYRSVVQEAGFFCHIRQSRGADDNAACGQLMTLNRHERNPSKPVR